MRVDEPESELSLKETEIERGPLDLADLTRQLQEALAEARAALHRAQMLQVEGRAAQERARLLRAQIQTEQRRRRKTKIAMSSGGLGRTLGAGIVAGVAAGVTMALFVMAMNVVYGDSFLDWLHYSAGIALGRSALPDSAPLFVVSVGLVVHLSLSALYGAIFSVAARYIKIVRRDLIVATAVFGLGLWIVNFYVFSPLLFPWFNDSPFIVQFIAHTIFYGIPLGVILLEFTPSGGVLGLSRRSA
ncbi:MAG: hypothetical protein J2P28_20740 [Actinobacteria bacterium]|nr:hypothetical protein [Actinomycetota bacterium]